MPTFETAVSYNALLFSSSISVVVLGLMLFMAYRLFSGNKRRAYRTLLISLGFIFIYQWLQLAWSAGWLSDAAILAFIGKLLQVFSFIVMNFAIFELYYKRRPRTRIWFYGLLALGALLAIAELLPLTLTPDESWAERLMNSPVLDGYLLLLSPLFMLMFGPHIGQPRKYIVGLAAVFIAQIFSLAELYLTAGSEEYRITAEALGVLYYILLFMLLFERVVELLMSAYRSSITDGLTNLYNRRYFTSQLERALRSNKPVTAIFCDIDNFKRLNDTHGHHRADGVLKQVASLLMEETEGIGLAGRYGGEELVAFVTNPPLAALQTAESIRALTAKESIVTISVGVSTSLPGSGITAEQLMSQADQAMYHSKATGKNRVTDYADLPQHDPEQPRH